MKHTKVENNPKKEEKVENKEVTNNQTETTQTETESKTEQKTDAHNSAETPVESELDIVKKSLNDLQSKYDQLNDTYLRSLAEFDNYRKRSLREKADLIKTGGESVLINVLSVVDDMERGLAATKEAQDIEAVKQGMELIYSKFQSFLKQSGITTIETEGKIFDTDLHEAITTIPAPSEDLKDKVIDCVQKGYYLHDKVIRFAKVVVGK
jgi:molecular chaperone GrpE